jgi:LPS-assembly lipoprotein
MSWSRATLACLALLTLAGCGWQPLYGRVSDGSGGTVGGNAGPALATVHVAPIANRVGQNLYNALRDRLNPGGAPTEPHYDLVIRIAESTDQPLVLEDQTATRINLTLNATYLLYQRGTRTPVFQGTSRATTSYDLLNDEYASIQSADDAHRRGALTLADDISERLAVFLAQPTGG